MIATIVDVTVMDDITGVRVTPSSSAFLEEA
jgi:hypothetical protein